MHNNYIKYKLHLHKLCFLVPESICLIHQKQFLVYTMHRLDEPIVQYQSPLVLHLFFFFKEAKSTIAHNLLMCIPAYLSWGTADKVG